MSLYSEGRVAELIHVQHFFWLSKLMSCHIHVEFVHLYVCRMNVTEPTVSVWKRGGFRGASIPHLQLVGFSNDCAGKKKLV